MSRNQNFMSRNQDFMSRNQDFMSRNQDFMSRNQDFISRNQDLSLSSSFISCITLYGLDLHCTVKVLVPNKVLGIFLNFSGNGSKTTYIDYSAYIIQSFLYGGNPIEAE